MIKRSLLSILFILFFKCGFAQLTNNGGTISIPVGSTLFVSGDFTSNGGTIQNAGTINVLGNWLNDNNTSLTILPSANLNIEGNFRNNTGTILNNGTLQLRGNWINEDATRSFNGAFNLASSGTINLSGANQTIGGTQETRFPSVILSGTGNKSLESNIFINGTLDLGDKQLILGNYDLTIVKGSADVINHTTGFINTGRDGKLYRVTNTTGSYNFPVGSDRGGVTKIRPVFLSPLDNQDNTFGVHFISDDPANFNLNTSQKRFDINQVNDKFFHVLDQRTGTSAADFAIQFNNPNDGNFNQLVSWTNAAIGWEKAGISLLQNTPTPSYPEINYSLTFRSSQPLLNFPIALASITPQNDPLTFFNTFTPDGDGKNDTWVIKNIDLFPENDLKILNRWGGEVFKAKGYNNANAWDGLGLNNGTYYYLLQVNVNGETKVYKGFITLLRNE